MRLEIEFEWTDERIEALKRLRADKKSFNEMAEIFGISRNAIAGKLRRLGLSKARALRTPKPKPPLPIRRTPLNRGRIKSLPIVEKEPEPLNGGVALIDLTEDQCRWPLGNGPFKFCGCAKAPGFPYCAGHVRVAYVRAYVSEEA